MFKIGDYVTRNSHKNDILFKIIAIKDSIYYLKGINIRLYADSFEEDLKGCTFKMDDFTPDIFDDQNLSRDEYFYLPGKVLHIDGDKDYLERCMKFYQKNKVHAKGIYLKESEMANQINGMLKEYKPDILVLTGHDSFSKNRDNSYMNTSFFVNAVKEARKYENSHDKLFIVAGACQSNYESLIKSGANFASSPRRVNIHALDPAIIASCLAFSNKNDKIDILKIINKTKYGSTGFGGIITKGSMYVGYPR